MVDRNRVTARPRALPWVLARHGLGLASLILGLALLGECAALTARTLHQDIALRLLKAAFFRLEGHPPGYLPLLAGGAGLALAGVWLTRTWPLPFLMFSAACFVSLGGAAAARGGLTALLADAAVTGDALMLLWLGGAAWPVGIFMSLRERRIPAPARRRPSVPAPAPSLDADPPSRTPVLKLLGTEGLVRGRVFVMAEKARATLGRGRACTFPLHALGSAASKGSPEGRAFRSISRRHVFLRFKDGEVRIECRSPSGTFVDGDRIDTVVLTDLASRPHTLRLGGVDTFRMEIVRV